MATIPAPPQTWDPQPDNNGVKVGIPMYEGMPPNLLNDGVRAVMAALYTALFSVASGLTASVTQTRIGALALTKNFNFVSVSANVGDSVSLWAIAGVGMTQYVYNDGANSIKIFPNGAAETIDGAGAGASVNLAAGKRCFFVAKSATAWESAQLGVVSA